MKQPSDPILIRNTWLEMLSCVPLVRPAVGAQYTTICTEVWTTPLGFLCQVSKGLGYWPYPTTPDGLEYAPANLVRAVGLKCLTSPDNDAGGHDVAWIEAMTDAGISFPKIAIAIGLRINQRATQGELK